MSQDLKAEFDKLFSEFEKNQINLNVLQQEKGFSRFLLIRSLGKEHLKGLILETNGEESLNNREPFLYKELYCSNISEEALISYINKCYPSVKSQREAQEEFLPRIIQGFGDVRCGVRNDNLNDVAKNLVRDKSIESREQLEIRINSLLTTTIKGYIEWQYYNQVTNDLIEHFFNNHPNVIPTLRKIRYVDFMVKIGDEIVPFDLKITHVSDGFFDLMSKGLTEEIEGKDSFSINTSAQSEFEKIKKFYNEVKQNLVFSGLSKIRKKDVKVFLESFLTHHPIESVIESITNFLQKDSFKLSEFKELCTQLNAEISGFESGKFVLPNLSGLSKPEVIGILENLNIDYVNAKLENFLQDRFSLIERIKDDLTPVEWWNYKFQGERLFKNNNRFYIFLAYEKSFEDARPLKGDLDSIKESVTAKLNEICKAAPHTIRYYYDKDQGLKGGYSIQSTSILHTR